MYKESTEKKSKHYKVKLIVQFLIIFTLSHIGRTLTTDSPIVVKTTQDNSIKKGQTLLQIEVDSIIAQDEKSANLLHQKSNREIEGVSVISREINDNGTLYALLSIPNNKSSWVINNPKDWKLIPQRKPTKKQRKTYEVIF